MEFNLNSNAPGQLLGYTIQFPRALFHLLKISTNGSVCIEVMGDVASFDSNGDTIAEEDKSSINSNPLTNKSKDLWKTFHNWINAIMNNEINIKKTNFILYCNQKGRKALVDNFNDFNTLSSAEELKKVIKEKLKDINSKHEIWTYYDNVINKNYDLFIEILKKFELQISEDSCYEEIYDALDDKMVPDGMKDYLIKILSGWLQFRIIDMIERKEKAIIHFSEFKKEFLSTFNKVRTESLIDWAIEPLTENEIAEHINNRPNYIQHLDAIDISNDKIIESISDYIKADINRNKWIETDVLDEEAAFDFENKLKSYHQNKKDQIQIINSQLEDEKKGQLLFIDCKSRQETINNLSPPDRTIPGTYHALTNRNEVGWHPNWKNIIKNKEG